MELDQGIIYPSQVVKIFEQEGFIKEPESKINGESGTEYSFDLSFEGYNLNSSLTLNSLWLL